MHSIRRKIQTFFTVSMHFQAVLYLWTVQKLSYFTLPTLIQSFTPVCHLLNPLQVIMSSPLHKVHKLSSLLDYHLLHPPLFAEWNILSILAFSAIEHLLFSTRHFPRTLYVYLSVVFHCQSSKEQAFETPTCRARTHPCLILNRAELS